jgi:uncharacterized iron-regulated protein
VADAAAHLTQLPLGDPQRAAREVPVVLDGISDTAREDLASPAELARRLEGVRVLFVGEEHTDADAHRVQLQVIEALHRAGRRVLVGLEMFPVTEQRVLDQWNEKLLTEAGFVQLSGWYEHWGYHWAYYREIFLFARDHGLDLHALNAPREVVTTMRMHGREALTSEHRALVPETFDIADPQFRELFRATFANGDPLHGDLPPEQFEGMLRAQATWDAVMGQQAAQAVEKTGDPQAIIVVLIGSGHVTYGLGAERQLRLAGYRGRIASLVPVHLATPAGEPVERVRASYANYVWGIPRQTWPEFPALGVSLAGRIGNEPTRIIQVSPDSPAARAGLAVRDILRALDGVPVDSFATLRRLQAQYRWGDVAQVEIERDGERRALEVPFRR